MLRPLFEELRKTNHSMTLTTSFEMLIHTIVIKCIWIETCNSFLMGMLIAQISITNYQFEFSGIWRSDVIIRQESTEMFLSGPFKVFSAVFSPAIATSTYFRLRPNT